MFVYGPPSPPQMCIRDRALDIARKIGDVNGEGACLLNLGIVYYELGDYPKSLEYYNQSLDIARKIGDIKTEGACLLNLGVVYKELGDYPKSLEYYNQSLDIARKINVPYDFVEGNIGDVYFEQGILDKAFEIYNKLGYSIPLGRYYLAKKDYTKAKEKFS